MNERLAALRELVLARWRGFYREPGVLFWAFGFPVLLSIALGVAFRNRPPEPVIAAVQEGPCGEATLAALKSSPDVRATILDEVKATGALRAGRVAVVVTCGPPRTYRYDPTRPDSRLARLVVDDALQRADGRVDPTSVVEARVSEPGSRYIDFLLPGLIGMGIMSAGLWGVGYAVVDMRTRKLIKRLLATPMRRTDFLAAFVIVRAFLLAVELPVLLGFGWGVFGVPIRGSLLLLAAVALLGSVTFAGIGLLLGSRAENTQTANGLVNLASMPMFIASGVFFSPSRFPAVVQPFVRLLPLTALNDAMRAIMLDGAGVVQIAFQLALLAAWAVVSFAIAVKIFRWS